jgi:hypothetical protein
MKPLFPELKKTGMKDLIGLKVVKVVSSLHDVVRSIQCEDEQGELHEITFRAVDTCYIAIELDGTEILNINGWKD